MTNVVSEGVNLEKDSGDNTNIKSENNLSEM